MAAREVLMRRQCQCVNIVSGSQTCTFCYSPIPKELTKRATDNYIWDHIGENLSKMARMSWVEIRNHDQYPVMHGHPHDICASNSTGFKIVPSNTEI